MSMTIGGFAGTSTLTPAKPWQTPRARDGHAESSLPPYRGPVSHDRDFSTALSPAVRWEKNSRNRIVKPEMKAYGGRVAPVASFCTAASPPVGGARREDKK